MIRAILPRTWLKDLAINCLITEGPRVVPLTCHGHSRPVTHLSFSQMVDEDSYFLISACKGWSLCYCVAHEPFAHVYSDGNPMLRDGITGDWYAFSIYYVQEDVNVAIG